MERCSASVMGASAHRPMGSRGGLTGWVVARPVERGAALSLLVEDIDAGQGVRVLPGLAASRAVHVLPGTTGIDVNGTTTDLLAAAEGAARAPSRNVGAGIVLRQRWARVLRHGRFSP